MSTTNQQRGATSFYPTEYQAFADKLLQAMTHALKVEDNRRKHGQICKVLSCLDRSEPVTVHGFWCQEAKDFAKEWETLRLATLQARADRAAYLLRLEEEDRARQATTSTPQEAPAPTPEENQEPTPAAPKAKRTYQKIEYTPGVNPFREGTKNAKIWDLLVEGGHTKEEMVSLSGADEKSVGYLIWLASGPNQIPVEKDKATKTYRLA